MVIKKVYFLILFVLLLVSPVVSASLQHGILGYVQNAEDGTSPKGAVVTFMIFRGTENYCNLTDVVGRNGNSIQPNWYAQDIGNCEKEWKAGDFVYINIIKGSRNVTSSVALTSNGIDQAPSVQLSSSGNDYITLLLVVIIVLLIMLVILFFLKRKKQQFKKEKPLK